MIRGCSINIRSHNFGICFTGPGFLLFYHCYAMVKGPACMKKPLNQDDGKEFIFVQSY